jgi:DNA-binding MarR family transcriptional regulator
MLDTNEIYDVIRRKTGKKIETTECLIWLYEKQKGDKYFMIYKSILEDRSLTLTDVRVYDYLCQIMKPGGWIMPTQAAIAADMLIHKAHINRVLRDLLKKGYILQELHPETKRKAYRVNPEYAYKGHTSMRNSYMRKKEIEKDETDE